MYCTEYEGTRSGLVPYPRTLVPSYTGTQRATGRSTRTSYSRTPVLRPQSFQPAATVAGKARLVDKRERRRRACRADHRRPINAGLSDLGRRHIELDHIRLDSGSVG